MVRHDAALTTTRSENQNLYFVMKGGKRLVWISVLLVHVANKAEILILIKLYANNTLSQYTYFSLEIAYCRYCSYAERMDYSALFEYRASK